MVCTVCMYLCMYVGGIAELAVGLSADSYGDRAAGTYTCIHTYIHLISKYIHTYTLQVRRLQLESDQRCEQLSAASEEKLRALTLEWQTKFNGMYICMYVHVCACMCIYV